MSSTEEVAAAAEAAKKTGLPVAATLTFDTARRSMMGVTPTEYAAFAQEIGLDLIGSNCGIGPAELMDSTTELLSADSGLPVIAKGNCGIPQYVDGEIHFHGSPELMAHYALHARDAGATVIGGCCGTTPEHLAAMVEALNSTPPRTSMVRQWRSSWASRGQICLAVVVKAVGVGLDDAKVELRLALRLLQSGFLRGFFSPDWPRKPGRS